VKPRLLDICCGEGGAGTGYDLAGFDVTGVDIEPQPRYPFTFIEGDALTIPLDGYDAYHVSPPCQGYSKRLRHLTSGYPLLIERLRDRVEATGKPWVVENVVGAPLPHQDDLFGRHGVELCGTMFGLPVWWHRLFEASFSLAAPRGCDHSLAPMNPHYAPSRKRIGYAPETQWSQQRGTGWMSKNGAREAIPPAYTKYIGERLITRVS